MSLRARLTLLYTTLLGGILLLLSLAVYLFLNYILINLVDRALAQKFEEIRLFNAGAEADNEVDLMRLPALDLTENVYAQIWDRHGRLEDTNAAGFNLSFDALGLQSPEPIFRSVIWQNIHLRVLTVPATRTVTIRVCRFGKFFDGVAARRATSASASSRVRTGKPCSR